MSRLAPNISCRLNAPYGPLTGQHLPVAVTRDAPGADGEHVALDIQVDRLLGDPRQIELDLDRSPSRPASIGITAGPLVVPSTC